ncbi:MAG: leucine-rich repeat protein [Acidobacteriota bacterium]|nr:leucine-rich repeat protein [Acidobacteriota bacterium]
MRDKLLEITGVSECEDVTSTHLKEVTELNLTGAGITALQEGDFSGLTNLNELELSENSLTTLPEKVFSGLTNLEYLWLDNNSTLTSLTAGIFSGLTNLKWLELFDNSITSLPVGIFSGLTNLTDLTLTDNSLTFLPEDIFSGLTNLTDLSLGGNSLSTLPEDIFSGLGNLDWLNLYDNSLASLPEEIFSGLSKLRILNLFKNSLTTLPEDLFSGLGNLKQLSLYDNDLTQLPATVFSGLDALELLRLNGNRFNNLPAGIFDDVVDTLGSNTSGNGLSVDSSLKATLSFASTAQTASEGTAVQVSATLSRALPVAVRVPFTIGGSAGDDDYEELSPAADSGLLFLAGETSKEITFTLSENNDNQVETLVLTLPQLSGIGLRRSDGTGADAPHLKTESLLSRSAASSTHTVTIPKPAGGICNRTAEIRDKLLELTGVTGCGNVASTHLEGVTSLIVSQSSISSLKAGDFSGLTQLINLKLDNNSLTSLPVGIFNGLSNLQELDLRSNSLSAVPAGIFSSLSALQFLSLTNNRLSTLPAGIFSGLSNLIRVGLSSNSLTSLPASIFSGLSNLQTLYLGSNSLTSLPASIFSGLGNLERLHFSGNPLTSIPVTVFNGLDSLENLQMGAISLTSLPAGIFDDILDTLGADSSVVGLSMDLSLKATLSFASTTQTASEGAAVQVSATLSRSLPVAVRVPFTIGGSASDDDYEELSPAADSGLLFLAGETSKEITFTLSENNDDREETLVLTLAQLSGIGLRRSDGTGADAPYLQTHRLLNRSATSSTHAVTIPRPSGGICDRTSEVRDKLLELTGVSGCANVTSTHLEGVTSLDLSDSSISALQAGDFSRLTQLTRLKLDDNSLTGLPAGIFSGLNSLRELDLRSNSLSALPPGIFDDILDTLGGNSGVDGLYLDSSLKATLSFASTAQTASEGAAVQVSATLSRALPVAVRVPFTIGGSADDGDYEGLSPAADSGLLFLAGETSKEIAFTLSENDDNREETLVLTLAQLSGIGLRRSDGSGSDAPHLETEGVLSRSATSSEHTVTIPKASGGICDRTSEVRDKLLELTSVSGCANVTSTHLEGVTSLDLSNSSISSLQAGDFGGLTQLTRLKLDNNSLTTLPAGIFSGLSRLQELDLRSNSLSSLSSGIFDDLLDTLGGNSGVDGLYLDSSLKATLGFASTAQTASEGAAVQVSATLSRALPVAVRVPFTIGGSADDDDYEGLSPAADSGLLFLAGETSKEIAFTLSENDDNQEETLVLTLAQLSGIGLRRSDGSGRDAPHLKTESLVSRSAATSTHTLTIPEPAGGICDRTTQVRDKLLELTGVSGCAKVTSTHLEGVTRLDLGLSSISALKAEDFSGLTRLEELLLNDNSLTMLPEGLFSGLSRLKLLELSENSLSALSQGMFQGLGSLESLSLWNNSLPSLPVGIFRGLSNLTFIGVHRNALRTLPEDTFSGLGKLEWLRLGDNRFNTLPAGIFSGLGNLRRLELGANNSLRTLPGDIFSGLSNLETLLLASNGLTQLPDGIFRGLHKLKTLQMGGNSLGTLPKGIFDDVLNTLGSDPRLNGLQVDADLKATLSFASTGQTASEGIAVRVSATLSRALPVAVRVPFTIGGSAADDDYEGLSPAGDSGLLFLAGETSKEIGFTLLENRDNQEETLVLTLAELSGIGLRRSDGTGADAPHLETHRLLIRSAASATHTVTISRYTEGICDRTAQVRDELLEVTGVELCADVSEDHLAEVAELKLSASGIASLKPQDFQGLSKLQTLFLSSNALSSLPAGIFNGLSGLQSLLLDHNSLQTLPPGVFIGLNALRNLWLNNNSLTRLPAGIFDDLLDTLGSTPGSTGLQLDSSLRAELAFASTASTGYEGTTVRVRATLSRALPVAVRVPFTIGGSATEDDYVGPSPAPDSGLLFLAGETSKEIAFTLSEEDDDQEESLVLTLAELVDIGLRRSDGTGTDAPFLNTERLLIRSAGNSEHTVTISDSELVEGFCDRTPQVRDKLLQITGVVVCTEMTVEQLAQVTGLDLRKSGITAFQAEDFRGLVSLQVLDLEKNKVGSLPEGIFSGLSSLQFLDLTNTKLRSLPVSVFNELVSLETLLLNVNSLRTLPLGVFSGLSNLQQLNLGSNRLSTLPDGIFSGLSSLQFLFLGGNRLGSLSEGIFSGLGNLVRLGLTGNSLSQLPESVFGGLNNLRYLHLSSNSLHSLPAGIFSGLGNLENLDLNGNPLSSLPVSVFNGLNSLESLQLAATSLNSLPAGIFDDVLDTLGLAPVLTGLLLNPHLMASLAFDSIAQTASEGTTVQVTATLSRELPVAVRVPYSLSGSATEDDYEGLSPAPQNGLLFLAGETSKGITFTLMENDDNQEETLVLTLGELSDIALRRADGTGPDAPHLDGESLLVRPAEGSMQVVTIQDTEGGICDRTTQVRDKLLEITASPQCEEVTAEQLDQVTELKLSDSGISTLQPQDFQGLSKLQNLVLSSNALSDLPLGTFNGLSSMRNLLLDHNSLYTLPAGLFRGLSDVRNLWLNGNSLTRLPSGIFDDMLGTLGSTPGSAGLLLDSSLKASLAFASTAQTAGAGTTVEVKVRLSRALPVALRVPYHLGGSAGSDDYTHLSPSPSEGLLFRAGSTDTEIVLTLGASAGIEDKTVVLTLGNLSDIGLRRSDGTGSDAPYLGSETLLERPETGSVHTITVARTDTGPVKAVFVPVILSLGGVNASFFTSEITLINRGSDQVALNYLYTAHAGGGSGRASEVIAPGRQKIVPDAFEHLNNLGIPVPRHGKRLGTLRVEVPVSSNVGVLVRTTTNVPDGRAGLAYLGIPEEEGFEEAVYLCGLRQNQQDRSNVAFQNMGAPEEGAITLRTTVYSGDVSDRRPRVLRDVRLAPGEFHQFNKVLGVLGSTANGYVKVERVEGTASFYAYGVINDQANSDGSFVFPVTAGSLERTAGQTLPVIVETSEFTSELTVTNFSEELRTLFFRFVAEGIRTDDMTTGFGITLNAGQQAIIADVVNELRRQGVAGLGSTRGFYAGPLFAEAEGGDMSGVVIGARTGSQGGGGQYSVFYTAVPAGEGFEETAWVYGLKQDEENRSNLALVNTGEVGDSESVFLIEIYDGETGLLAQTVVTRPIPAGHWHQFDGILGNYAPETRQGYVRILKVSGENPFLAYGVVNDGGAPGARSGDGAYVPAQE